MSNLLIFLVVSTLVMRFGSNSVSAQAAKNQSVYISPKSTSARRAYLRPALAVQSPASCDLTPNVCDLNCCTDKDCNAYQKESYKCPLKSESSGHSDDWDCNKRKPHSPFWFPLLCYVRNNSPYLGKYFPSVTINDVEPFKKHAKHDYRFVAPSRKTQNSIKDNVVGSYLKITKKTNAKRSHIELPNRFSHSGACSINEPVRYLEEVHTKCIQRISPAICQGGDLSIDKYFLEHDSLLVNKDKENPVNITSTFLCYEGTTNQFVKNFSPRKMNSYINTTKISRNVEECDKEARTRYDNTTGVCFNVLVSLQYEFAWNGSNITSLHATYVAANVPVSSLMFISRQFDVTFSHANKNATDDPLVRSGSPGYISGKPLIVGTLRWENDTSENNGSWDWEPGHLALLRADIGGSCVDAEQVVFGMDMMTTCYMTVTDEDISSNCTNVRTLLNHKIESLIDGKHVAKSGDFKFEGMHSVVPILRNENTSTSAKCESVPTRIVMQVMYSQHTVTGIKIQRLVGVSLSISRRNISSPVTFSVTSSVRFIRLDEPSSISRFWRRMSEPSEAAWREILTPLWHVLATGDGALDLLLLWTVFLTGLITAVTLHAVNTR